MTQPTDDGTDWLTAGEAAERLNIKRETIYAYVSRGRLASRRSSDGRGSVFDPADVERLAARVRRNGRPGVPTMESEITLIQDGRLFYRGQAADELASTRSFEEVAETLWASNARRGRPWQADEELARTGLSVLEVLPHISLPIDQIRVAAAVIGATEPPLWDSNPDVVAASARRLLMTIVASLPRRSEVASWENGPTAGVLVPLVWSRLCDRQPTTSELETLSAAMVLSADHDLAAATVVARTAARAGVDPGGIIRVGLDVGSGPVKGAAGLAIETFLRNVDSPSSVGAALTRRLRLGEPIPGFGHVMYPDGDPRASHVLERLRQTADDSDRLNTVDEVIARQLERGLPPPNDGFALAALAYVANMVPDAGEVIFVIARSVGWIAHALEEYGHEPLQRQSAVYLGLQAARSSR